MLLNDTLQRRTETKQEQLIKGLTGRAPKPEVQVRVDPNKGRGVYLLGSTKKGSYMLEYKTLHVYRRPKKPSYEEEYKANGEPSIMCFWKWTNASTKR